MHYYECQNILNKVFSDTAKESVHPELQLRITRRDFISIGENILPGAEHYACKEHKILFSESTPIPPREENSVIEINDYHIRKNKFFPYTIVTPHDSTLCKGVIFLFHGLNEKKWTKYLPWVHALIKATGKAVILFPLAFHMERAPNLWSDTRKMRQVSDHRSLTTDNSASSFVNAAISVRLELDPQRIFWSGFQTYIDMRQMISSLRQGELPYINKDATIDFFGYSIGAFFSLILLAANPKSYLDRSRFFAFCGGATLDRMYPISKYILDMRSSIAIQKFYEEQLNTGFLSDERLRHYLSEEHPEQNFFKSILKYRYFRELREERMLSLSDRIYAVALIKDDVVPPHEVMNTLQGSYRNIPIPVDILDFDYPYSHIRPFSPEIKYAPLVDEAFSTVMGKATAFLQ